MSCVKYIWVRGNKKLLQEIIFKKDTMDQEMEILIWDFIDGRTGSQEKDFVIKQIAEDPLWKACYLQQLGIHDMLKKVELEMPSLRFSKNIMEGNC